MIASESTQHLRESALCRGPTLTAMVSRVESAHAAPATKHTAV